MEENKKNDWIYLHSVCDEVRADRRQLARTRSPSRRQRHWIRNANGANRMPHRRASGGGRCRRWPSSGQPAPRHFSLRELESKRKKDEKKKRKRRKYIKMGVIKVRQQSGSSKTTPGLKRPCVHIQCVYSSLLPPKKTKKFARKTKIQIR